MRISGAKVVQLIESEVPVLVIVDENTGCEMEFKPGEVINLGKALDYFAEHVPSYQR